MTIVERVAMFLQGEYLRLNKKIPLILRLNRYAEANNLAQFIESQIEFSLKKKVPANRIYDLCTKGRAVLFLDGFDEIATNASGFPKVSGLEYFFRLIDRSRFTIMSSRPTDFKSASEFHSLITSVLNCRFNFGSLERSSRGRDITSR